MEYFLGEKNDYFSLTSGCGEPWPEHSMWPPVLLENSTLCGGSCEKTGPCRSNSNVSESKYKRNIWEKGHQNRRKYTPKKRITTHTNKSKNNVIHTKGQKMINEILYFLVGNAKAKYLLNRSLNVPARIHKAFWMKCAHLSKINTLKSFEQMVQTPLARK